MIFKLNIYIYFKKELSAILAIRKIIKQIIEINLI